MLGVANVEGDILDGVQLFRVRTLGLALVTELAFSSFWLHELSLCHVYFNLYLDSFLTENCSVPAQTFRSIVASNVSLRSVVDRYASYPVWSVTAFVRSILELEFPHRTN